MLLGCPHCGPRNSSEFRYVGEQRTRPDVNATDPAEWHAYLYLQSNPAGWVTETWLHRTGCRQYLTAERHTVTGEVRPMRPAAGGLDDQRAAGGDIPIAVTDAATDRGSATA